jgi:hypothetical protein
MRRVLAVWRVAQGGRQAQSLPNCQGFPAVTTPTI